MNLARISWRKLDNKCVKKITGQKWKLEGTKLTNQTGKWISKVNWELPEEGSTGYIKDIDRKMVLGAVNKERLMETMNCFKDCSINYALPSKGSEVHFMVENSENINNDGQMWKRGPNDNDGFFTLTNLAYDKALTARPNKTSTDNLVIESMY